MKQKPALLTILAVVLFAITSIMLSSQPTPVGGGATGPTGPTGATGAGGVWGSITGTLSSQTDLQTDLNAKLGTGSTLTPTSCTNQFPTGIAPTTGNATGCATVDYAQLAPDVLGISQTTLTSAQIKALNTPIQLIGAPGAGKIIIPISVTWETEFGTTAYTGGVGAGVNITYQANGYSFSVGVTDAFIKLTSSAVYVDQLATLGNIYQPTSRNVNAAIYVQTPAGSYATGDGTLLIVIVYQVLSGF
jgi:hypothetical protein